MDDNQTPDAESVIAFWFDQLTEADHWRKDEALDRAIAARFEGLVAAARRCELFAWRRSAPGRLAEIIVLDQFPRNIFRDRSEAFQSDPLALALAQTAVAAGADADLPPQKRGFLYLPYVHSESALIQALAIPLLEAPGLEAFLASARRHKAVIDRFGRFPHRNAVLGRPSTPEETDFLMTPGARF